ncbi:hypothetical protein SAMN04488112_103103 [Melghirimyces thermohalophilus]|uniref:Uncharacterized protein n=1 Tax=Melghirimyces thermohalophilus TaxID=1236220 RepID=A0A1G6IYL8_9BACL|nr:hypothetical protein [Melghirimyces thermohalophilus]SDC11520.1 hypothetical protein SAMN04488112_103103 [Melghirimyces thermohalophilus]
MNIRFSTPHQYVFIHEDVKHLLILWSKEAKKQLFVVEEEGECMTLTYPGETYLETVWAQVEPVFFRRLETEEADFPVVLGATFHFRGQRIGMYYNREQPSGPPYFFRLADGELKDIPDEEYEEVARTFMNEFPEYIQEEKNS